MSPSTRTLTCGTSMANDSLRSNAAKIGGYRAETSCEALPPGLRTTEFVGWLARLVSSSGLTLGPMAASYALSSHEREFSSRAALTIPIHLFALGALYTGARAFDWVVLLVLYAGRMFFLTAGYHRYFAHRAFRTSRLVQFLLAWGGCTALQRGPLWWAGHHRRHHRFSDRPLDVHSPKKGLYWSHYGWVLGRRNDATPLEYVRDLNVFPELRWLNTYYFVPGLLLMASVFAAGWLSGG